MPKQLVATAPRKAELLPYEEPALLPHQIRVRVEYASPKHGSELADFRGESPFNEHYFDEAWLAFLPRDAEHEEPSKFGSWNVGNQWVGIVTEAGSEVLDYEIGDRVCSYGGIRESHVVNAVNNHRLFKVPSGMSWKNAVCYDPAQFALGGIRDGQIKLGDRVAVFGLGAIGAIAAQMAKRAGASYVAVIDPIENRRQSALKAGADDAFDPVSQDVGLELKKATERCGVDVVIETSGHETALQAALRGLAYGGTIAYLGWARPFRSALDLGKEAHFNNAKIVFSRAASEPNPEYPRWSRRRIEQTCWALLSEGLIDCEDIVHPVIGFEESAEGYEEYVDRQPAKSIKLGIRF
ncbi:MAG: alcohol dehydrogenase [Paenibacillus sp.]|jgi:threonine dehydrogenase-like Zn-dependent dehydrogenase|nr:alcohol dehydrogenase [Paenibacillus sp.]